MLIQYMYLHHQGDFLHDYCRKLSVDQWSWWCRQNLNMQSSSAPLLHYIVTALPNSSSLTNKLMLIFRLPFFPIINDSSRMKTHWKLHSTEKLSVELVVFTLVVCLPICVHHATHLARHMTKRLLTQVLRDKTITHDRS